MELSSIASSLKKLGIICSTETHFNTKICDAEVSIPNFNIFREDRQGGKKGGGSAIYVKKDFVAEKMNWFQGTESVAVKVKFQSFDLYVVCLYRSPSLKSLEENAK